MAYQMDFFAANNEAKVLAAINAGTVKYPAYCFIRSEDGSATGRLAFVDQNNVLKYVVGDEAKKQVLNVEELPEVGDVEVLYIMGGIVYVFDGTEYKPAYKDHTAELEALTQRVETLETSSVEVATKVENLETEVNSIDEQISALEERLNSIEIPEECKCGAEYEFVDTPSGTLVDYRDGEIRIMCPSDAEWKKQTVGTNGDPNCYYGTLKVYVPDEAITGYIEHLGDQVDAEILDTFSIDEKGRRYQPTWLALARYDEATDTWTYYGKDSTINKYMGWNYRIDWYNSDGVMIASDSIRINLSNEDCHFVIEPYYISGIKADVETLKENSVEVAEKLATITEQMTDIEERVTVVEKESLTFVELE